MYIANVYSRYSWTEDRLTLSRSSKPWFCAWLRVRISPPLPMIRSNSDLPSILSADGKPIITVVQEADIHPYQWSSIYGHHLASNHTGTPVTQNKRQKWMLKPNLEAELERFWEAQK